MLEANAASALLLGHELHFIQGRPLADSLPPPARAAVAELLAHARSTGRAGEIRVRGLAKAGAIDVSATPFRVDNQQQILVRARRDDNPAGAQDTLALSRMAEFVETTPDAVVITDASGSILMANPAFLRLTRQADESRLRGQLLPGLLIDADGAWQRLVERVRSAGMVSNAALTVSAFGGSSQGVRVSAALMAESDQACLGFILRPGHSLPPHLAGDDVLAGLLDQVGRVPLADLLVEVAHRAERQLIESALVRTGGQRSAAADALGMTPEALELRIQRHGLSGLGYPADGSGPSPLIN